MCSLKVMEKQKRTLFSLLLCGEGNGKDIFQSEYFEKEYTFHEKIPFVKSLKAKIHQLKVH